MTTVAISQPMYFPWAGFFEMLRLADVLVWLDDAQFSKGSFTNRIQVKTPKGRAWMTVPLAGSTGRRIRDLAAVDDDWPRRHRELLAQSFRDRPAADAALGLFDAAMAPPGLAARLVASCEGLGAALGALPPRILSADALAPEGKGSERVLALCKAAGATRYVSGAGGAAYLDHAAFEAAGVSVCYMAYDPSPWPQPWGEFTPYVTALDLVASCGDEAARCLRPAVTPWRERLAEIAKGEAP